MQASQSSHRVTALALMCLALAAVALYAPAIIEGKLLVARDLWTFSIPRWLGLTHQALEEGQIPRWNPLCGSGGSWFGARGGGVVYPAHVVFFVWDMARAAGVFLAAHAFLGSAGVFALVRAHGGGRRAAVAAGLTFGVGGFLASMHGIPVYLVSGAWLPWAALGGDRIRRGDRPFGAGIAALAVGACLLVGDPAGALLAAGVIVGFAVPASRTTQAVLTCGAAAVAAVALGGGLGSWQVMSLLDELPWTQRSLADWSDTRYSPSLVALGVDLTIPGLLGDRSPHALWGGGIYGEYPWCGLSVGAVGFVSALGATRAAGAAGSKRLLWAGGVLAVIGVGLAVTGVGSLVKLRFPAKFLVLSALGVSLWVGVGFPGLLSKGKRATQVLAALAGVAGVVAVACALAPAGLERWMESVARRTPGLVVDGAAARAATVEACARFLALALVALAILLSHRRGWLTRRLAGALLLAVLAADLVSTQRPYLLREDPALLGAPELVTLLRPKTPQPTDTPSPPVRLWTDSRFLAGRQDPHALAGRRQAQLVPNVGYCFGIRTLDPFESSVDGLRYALRQRAPRRASFSAANYMARFDVEYLLQRQEEPADPKGVLQPVGPVASEGLRLVRNTACPPWAYGVLRAKHTDDVEQAVAWTFRPGVPPLREVVLGPGGPADPPLAPGNDGPAPTLELLSFDSERIETQVHAATPGWVVLRESYHPDWEASLNGDSVPIWQADLLYRAVHVPDGDHRLVLRYDPWWWAPSRSATLFAIVVTLLLLGAGLRRGDARRPPSVA